MSKNIENTYISRKIDSFLLEWKGRNDHKPLIVKGQRQIGKTESIRNFAKNYDNFIEINFAIEDKYKSIISDGYTEENIIKNISLIDNDKKFVPHKTLIFFDEIQDFPDITTSLKSFAFNKNYDVICSGSLLGFNYKQINSISVGYKEDYLMHSFDFEEFLYAKGYDDSHVNDILKHMVDIVPFNKTEIETYQRLFLEYQVLGGMPEVIKMYINNNAFTDVLNIQRKIIDTYKDDMRKYAEGLDQTKIVSVFNSIPYQLSKENRKFQYSKIKSGARARDYEGVIEWLEDAGIINICPMMHFPELPVKGNVDMSKFKIYYRDTGLLISQLDNEALDDIKVNKNLGVYKGAIYENMIADAFFKQGLPLCYYKRDDATLEMDFFIRRKDELLPVEVKSNDNRSQSLKTLIRSEKYKDIKNGIKLAYANVGYENNIYTFPYFCAFLIKRFIEESK